MRPQSFFQYKIDINKFERIEKLGRGGFGFVYKVQAKDTKEVYAEKVISCHDDEQFEKIIDREIGIMMCTNHPTIIKLIGYCLPNFPDNNDVSILMELAAKGSLANLLHEIQKGNIPPNYTNTNRQIILVGVARGMKYLHDRNIIHRDLKPGNILLNEYFQPQISDFGTSKISEIDHSFSLSETPGTLCYMAPEVINGEHYNQKADVFSFAILMYEVVTNLYPYPELQKGTLNRFQFSKKVVDDDYRPKFKGPVKKSIQDLIIQCWSRNPINRPTFKEIFDKLAHGIPDDNKAYFLDDVKINELQDYISSISSITDPIDDLINKVEKLSLENNRLLKENQHLKSKIENNLQLELDNKSLKSQIMQLEKENQKLLNELENSKKNKQTKNLEKLDLDINTYKCCLQQRSFINKMTFSNVLIKPQTFDKNEIEKYKKDSQLNNPFAQTKLGLLYFFGNEYLNKDIKKAIELLEKAASQNYTEAELILGSIYFNDTDYDKAASLFEKAADKGNSHAKNMLAIIYIDNLSTKYPQNLKKGVALLRDAAEHGNPNAQFNIGICYMKGIGVDIDLEKVLDWHSRAADKGHVDAMFNVAMIYSSGVRIEEDEFSIEYEEEEEFSYLIKKNIRLSLRCFKRAASFNHPEALYNLAILILDNDIDENGKIYNTKENENDKEGFEKRKIKRAKESLSYFERAADAGIAEANFYLGTLYESGSPDDITDDDISVICLPKDMKKAIKYYHRAAELDHFSAKYNLGVIYLKGDEESGVPPDREKAIKFFKLAAECGNPDAKNILNFL